MLKRVILCFLGMAIAFVVPLVSQPSGARTTAPTPGAVIEEPAIEIEADLQRIPGAISAPGLGDPQELEAFVDRFMSNEMLPEKVPGAAISIVQGDEIVLAKGYGYADLDENIPVDADRTLFRVASLSKLFTATATMQLDTQGLLDIDEDISDYLGDRVELDNPFAEPVTFARLMMHVEGSSKRRIGLAADTEAKLQSLEDYLAEKTPPIVRPPGEYYAYSSHTIALLGYLVQRISGEPFIDYIDRNIFQPLEMSRSTFLQPPPPELRSNLATGYYQSRRGNLQAVPYLYLNIGPAAALQTTAVDMAHFTIAHLQGGRYGDARILPAEAIEEMHETHYAPHPQLPGTGYGFRERLVNNLRTIGHLGSLRGYSSSLTLVPDEDIGIFIAANSYSGIHGKFLAQFFDHYFPVEDASTPSPESSSATEVNLGELTGAYWDLEYPHHTLAKLSAPYQRLKIVQTPEGGLEIQFPLLFFGSSDRPVPLELLDADSLLFRRVGENALMAFSITEDGTVYAHNPVFAKIGSYQRARWYQNIWLHVGLLAAMVLLFLSAIWVAILRPILRSLRGKNSKMQQRHGGAWLLAGVVCLANLIFLIGFPLSLWLYGAWRLAYGMPTFGLIFLGIPIVSAVLTVAMAFVAVMSWKDWRWGTRSHYSLVTLAAAGFAGILAYWNLLGFQF